jgi:hypothetical protein
MIRDMSLLTFLISLGERGIESLTIVGPFSPGQLRLDCPNWSVTYKAAENCGNDFAVLGSEVSPSV